VLGQAVGVIVLFANVAANEICSHHMMVVQAFQEKWRQVKVQKKAQLAAVIKNMTGDDVNPDAMFDIHVR
jgi:glucan phosphorylase